MTDSTNRLYSFAFRGLLAEENLDREGRVNKHIVGLSHEEIAKSVGLDLLDDMHVTNAEKMAIVYSAIAAFENTVRGVIRTVLMDEHEEEWWEKGFSKSIRDKAERRMKDEQNTRWHAQRGQDPINYTDFSDPKNTVNRNWALFEDSISTPQWAASVFDAIERSRNVIMHSGSLDPKDIERLGIHIRDWVQQVGA